MHYCDGPVLSTALYLLIAPNVLQLLVSRGEHRKKAFLVLLKIELFSNTIFKIGSSNLHFEL